MTMFNKSVITRIVSNRYHVYHNNKIVEAVAMGKLRLGQKPIVGDEVKIEFLEEKYVIQEVLPRRNSLIRPLVANVDQALIVMSALEPDFSYTLVDRLIFLVALEGIEPVIVLTKTDLISEEKKNEIELEYTQAGYRFIALNKFDDASELSDVLAGKISVLAGQSGVGKSSILNRMNQDFSLQTQEISKALGRGKHTTRHNQLYNVENGWIADTPGFSSLNFSKVDPLELAQKVPDFAPFVSECRYRDCLHVSEPSCKIKEELEKEKISKVRYQNYCDVLDLIKEERR
ncbi:ribosome small subunit-dependent GTPase A [Erysipelothrix urinaevulpis]|uniref:ribosome small subunit-dependent GTPase A n=1 Tax=Erysipelothrix urinaevulpis TaxID=2683717 RepID=UPI0038B3AFC7